MASTTPADYTNTPQENEKNAQNFYARRNIVPPKELTTIDEEPVDTGCAEIPRFDFLMSFHAMKSNKYPLIITESEAQDHRVGLEPQEIESHDLHDISFRGEKKPKTSLPNNQLIHEYAKYFEEEKHQAFESLISKIYENNARSQFNQQQPEVGVNNQPQKAKEVNDAVNELAGLQLKYNSEILKEAIKIAFPEAIDVSSELANLSKEHEKLKEIHLTLLKSLIDDKKSNAEVIVMLKQQNEKPNQEYLSVKSERDVQQSKENDSEVKTAAISQHLADESIFEKQRYNDSDYDYEPIGETLEEVELVIPKDDTETPVTNIRNEKAYINQTPKSLADANDEHEHNVVRKEPLVDIKQSDMSDDRSAQEHAFPIHEHFVHAVHPSHFIQPTPIFTKVHQQFTDYNSNGPFFQNQIPYENSYSIPKPIELQPQKYAVFENQVPQQGSIYRYSPMLHNRIAYPPIQSPVLNRAVTSLNRERFSIIRHIEGQQFKNDMSHSAERKNKVTRISLNDYLSTMKRNSTITQVVPEKPLVVPAYTGASPVARDPINIPPQESIQRVPYQSIPVAINVNPVPLQVAPPQIWRQAQAQTDSIRNIQTTSHVTWVNQPRHTFGVPSELTYQPISNFGFPNKFANAERSQQPEANDLLKRRTAQPRLENPDQQNIYFAYELYSSENPEQQSGRFINTVSTYW